MGGSESPSTWLRPKTTWGTRRHGEITHMKSPPSLYSCMCRVLQWVPLLRDHPKYIKKINGLTKDVV